MSFWDLQFPSDGVALVDESTGSSWTYGELRRSLEEVTGAFPPRGRKRLGLILCHNSPECISAYLAALRTRDAVILLDAILDPELVRPIVANYAPDWILAPAAAVGFHGYSRIPGRGKYGFLASETDAEPEIHPELAILLSTSGSTGSPKLVRLTYGNLSANAASIAEYLGLSVEERPVTTLPMPYSYGLSVINSHLQAGATILLTDRSILQREFWSFFREAKATSMAGVPYTYQMLLRMRLLKKDLPSLRTLTQAGGRLDPPFIREVQDISLSKGWRFFVMYGQTEATARISYVPVERLADKIGSIGICIPGGTMSVDAESSELVYTGPNVMLGYAEHLSDLAKGDELHGVLHTGDLARQDADGFFYVVGRMKRFLKIFGQRFNLDEVEIMLRQKLAVPVACFGEDDLMVIALEAGNDVSSHASKLMEELYHLHHRAFRIVRLESIPHNARGKTDYQALAQHATACAD